MRIAILVATSVLFFGCAPFSPKTTCDLSSAGLQTAYLEYTGSCDEVISAIAVARDMMIEANILTTEQYQQQFAKMDLWIYESARLPTSDYKIEPTGRYHEDYIELGRYMPAAVHEMEHHVEHRIQGLSLDQMVTHANFRKGMPFRVLDDKYYWIQYWKTPLDQRNNLH